MKTKVKEPYFILGSAYADPVWVMILDKFIASTDTFKVYFPVVSGFDCENVRDNPPVKESELNEGINDFIRLDGIKVEPWSGMKSSIQITGNLDNISRALILKYASRKSSLLWSYELLKDNKVILYVADYTDRLIYGQENIEIAEGIIKSLNTMSAKDSKLETEQKFQVLSDTSVEEIEKILIAMGLEKTGVDEQKDIYWDNEVCKMNNLKRGLRFRYISGVLKTIELKSLFVADNRENFVVEEVSLLNNGKLDLEGLRTILVDRLGMVTNSQIDAVDSNLLPEDQLTSLCLKPAIILDKTRHLFMDKAKNIEVGIDQIKGLNLFIEVELASTDESAYLDFLERLQDHNSLKIVQVYMGYTDLLSSQNPHLKSKEVYDALFATNPSWNVLETERELVADLFKKKIL